MLYANKLGQIPLEFIHVTLKNKAATTGCFNDDLRKFFGTFTEIPGPIEEWY